MILGTVTSLNMEVLYEQHSRLQNRFLQSVDATHAKWTWPGKITWQSPLALRQQEDKQPPKTQHKKQHKSIYTNIHHDIQSLSQI